MPVSIVVPDAEQRSALAVVRSLGRAGYRVHVCSASSSPIAGASRYANTCQRVPDPLTSPAEFAHALARRATAVGASIVLPVTDASSLAVLRNRDLFHSMLLPFPRDDRFVALSDKALVLERARDCGIAVPQQHAIATRDAGLAAAESLRFPIVIKPARTVAFGAGGMSKHPVSYADSISRLSDVLHLLPDHAFPVLFQEQIRGPGVGVFALLWKGELIAAFSHERIREKPPSGGVCVLGESRAMDASLLQRSVELLRSFAWEGAAMVEFKISRESGEPHLMEVNPRFWGSLQLAIDSGVDFPLLLVRLLLGASVAPVLQYNTGNRLRWFWGDVDNLIARLRRPARRGDGVAESRGAALREFLGSFAGGVREEICRASDPKPFLTESWNWVRRR